MVGARTRRMQDLLKSVEGDVNRFEEALSKFADVNPNTTYIAGQRAAEAVRSDVVSILVSQYRASGLGERTGKLLDAVRQSEVFFDYAKARLGIRMARNLGRYKGGSTVYRVAASQEYGAVRTKREKRTIYDIPKSVRGIGYIVDVRKAPKLGEKAKRSLKKQAIGQELSAQALANLRTGYQAKGVQITSGITQGDYIVVPPKPFFRLDKSSALRITAKWLENFLMELAALVG